MNDFFAFFASLGSLALTIIVFLIIFAILIVWHELGHFLTARLAKVKVLEFGFGMPPKIWGKKTIRTTKNDAGEYEEMEWTINAIPFGGFVRMLGEDGTNTDHPNAFGNRPLLWRMLVICGGVIMNFILGWAIFTYAFTVGMDPNPISKEQYNQFIEEGLLVKKEGLFVLDSPLEEIHAGDRIIKNNDDTTPLQIERFNTETKQFEMVAIPALQNINIEHAQIQITSVQSGSPAEQAGLEKGDIIVSINGEKLSKISHIKEVIEANPDKNIEVGIIQYSDKGEEHKTLSITPNENGIIGISSQFIPSPIKNTLSVMESGHVFPVKQQKYNIVTSAQKAFTHSFQVMGLSIDALGNFITQLISDQSIPDEMGGPVAIAHHTDTLLEYGNVMSLVIFTAMLSLSLAVLNIMPFPGLDGGRFIFLLIEGVLLILTFISTKIFRTSYQFPTRLPASLEGIINALGFITLLILLFWITGNDILKLLW